MTLHDDLRVDSALVFFKWTNLSICEFLQLWEKRSQVKDWYNVSAVYVKNFRMVQKTLSKETSLK